MQPVFDLSSVHRFKHPGAIDADGHVLEPGDLWDTYIEARYRDRALRIKRDQDGLEYLEIGRGEGRVVTGGNDMSSDGYFLPPTVIADVDSKARIFQEEIFGPVLAVARAKNFDQALALANDSQYGLTGAIYSNDSANVERAREEFFVGNMYVNRKCTGAMVGAHPFGGFNMSGTDSKAGGPDYLLLFLQAKSIAEKVAPKPTPVGGDM